MLSNQEILETIESSFAPFKCVAEIYDHDSKIQFTVFSSDNIPYICKNDMLRLDMQHDSYLHNKITAFKSFLELHRNLVFDTP